MAAVGRRRSNTIPCEWEGAVSSGRNCAGYASLDETPDDNTPGRDACGGRGHNELDLRDCAVSKVARLPRLSPPVHHHHMTVAKWEQQ